MPDPWKGWDALAPKGPTLDSFRPARVKLRAAGKAVHVGGIVRQRATLDTRSGKNPKHGYLTAIAKQSKHPAHGYLLKGVREKRKAKQGG